MEQNKNVTIEDAKSIEKLEVVKHELFNIVKCPRGYFLAVNNKIVSDKLFKTVEQAKKYIDSKPWDLLINTACLCYEIMKEENVKSDK